MSRIEEIKLSVVIPVYNERDYILEIIQRVKAVGLVREIIVVDDCSTDGTRDVLTAIDDPLVQVFFHEQNQGKGAALRTGFSRVSGDMVIVQDADLEYDPQEYSRLIKPIMDGKADVVYGSRFIGGDAHRVVYFWHMIGNKFLTLISNMLTNLTLTDMETCYKVFTRQVIKNITIEENRFGFEPEVTAKVAKMDVRVYEVGISYDGRNYDQGKKIGWKDGFSAIRCIIKYNLLRSRQVTRGPGLLEGLLARKRSAMANSLISNGLRSGKIVDIGCGAHPLFLLTCGFREMIGIDTHSTEKRLYDRCWGRHIQLVNHDIETAGRLPFEDNSVATVTMLAVIEHISPEIIQDVVRDIYRVIKPGGVFVLTTPTSVCQSVLWFLAKVNMISTTEFEDHKKIYSRATLATLLSSAGFDPLQVRTGSFEMGLNLWVVGQK